MKYSTLRYAQAIWNKIKAAAAKKFKIDLGPEAGPPSLEAKKSIQSKETEMIRDIQEEVFKAIMESETSRSHET